MKKSESIIKEGFIANGLTLSVAESCTGGMICDHLTNVSGSSDYFLSGIIPYSNDAKVKLLCVNRSTIDDFGAVSKETALEMAQGVRMIGGADIGLSVTGIAGPGGGSRKKPVGLVYIAVADRKETNCKKFVFKGSRSGIKKKAAEAALTLLMKKLQVIEKQKNK